MQKNIIHQRIDDYISGLNWYENEINLVRNPGKVYSREQLLDLVWGYDYQGDIRTVDVHIRRLREKLERNPAAPEYIITKWGVGYYFAEA